MENTYIKGYQNKKAYFLVGQKAILKRVDNKILILKRSSKAGNEGTWSLPGGGLDKDEDPFKGIIREIIEETGLHVKDIQLLDVVTFTEKGDEGDDDPAIMIAYQAQPIDDNVDLNWEHDAFKWVTKEEALELLNSPILKRFIK